MLSGVTQLVMTKSDVLDGFDPIRVCTGYSCGEGDFSRMPFDINGMEIKPQYESFPGWLTDTNCCRQFDQLPQQMKEFIRFVEDKTRVPVKYVSNGPGRDQVLVNG